MAKCQVDSLLSYLVMGENVIDEVISGATEYSYITSWLVSAYDFYSLIVKIMLTTINCTVKSTQRPQRVANDFIRAN